MKKRLVILIGLVMVLSCVVLTACGGSSDDLSDSKYVGSWIIDTVSLGEESDALGEDWVLTVNGDGTGTFSGDGESSDFTWEPTDNGFKTKGDVKMKFEDEGEGIKASIMGAELHFVKQE